MKMENTEQKKKKETKLKALHATCMWPLRGKNFLPFSSFQKKFRKYRKNGKNI